MKLSLIIPARNEEKRISATLEAYTGFLDCLTECGELDYEILIVINNTTDDTESVVRKFAETHPRVRYLTLVTRGKGSAVIQGFKDAIARDGDFIGFVDADMATPPDSYYDLIRGIGRADAAIACRYMPGSEIVPRYSFRRSVVAKCFNILVRLLLFLPFNDTQCGAKLFRKEAIRSVVDDIGTSQWAFDVEILYKLHRSGFRIREVPTHWIDVAGSKLKLAGDSLGMFFAVLRLRVEKSVFRGILPPLEPVLKLIRNKLR